MSSTNIMNKNKKNSSTTYKSILIVILAISLILLTSFNQVPIIFIIIRNILAIIFILFLSGYVLVSILFQEEKLEFSEFSIYCIGLSICISILDSMIIHFLGIKVNFVNIVNIISITTIILTVVNFFKVPLLKKHFGEEI